MEVNRTSAFQTLRGKVVRGGANVWSSATKLLSGVAPLVADKLWPWCRNHLVSIAVLGVVSMGFVGFCWNRPAPEQSSVSPSLNWAGEDASMSRPNSLPQIKEGPLVSVVPDVSLGTESPRVFDFSHSIRQAEMSFPQPLPIAVDSPEAISGDHPRGTLPWEPNAITAYQTSRSITECVWLTGSIEPVEESRESPRAQELSTPFPH